RFKLDCDFQRVPWYFFATSDKDSEKIEKEYETATKAGIEMETASQAEIPFSISKGVKVGGQAQINPMRYVQELANSIKSENCSIFEHSRVLDIEEEDNLVTVKTAGGKVTANYALHATHTPKGVR